jgi:hypothetical protein
MTSPLPWIKVYGDLPTHRKSVTLAALLGEPRAWTHVVELWLWVSRHAPEGDLGKMPDAAVAAVAGWRGDASAFVNALRVAGFLDDTHVHGWHEHNGAHFRKQAADKARNEQKKAESQVRENVVTSDSLVIRENVTSVESREYREENKDKDPEKNLALFAGAPSEGTQEKAPRGRPPKDTPEIVSDRERWLAKARALVGLTPEESPEGKVLCIRFAQARKKRGMEQLMRALEGLEGDQWAKQQGLQTLLSDTLVEKGLAKWNKGATTLHVGRIRHGVGPINLDDLYAEDGR